MLQVTQTRGETLCVHPEPSLCGLFYLSQWRSGHQEEERQEDKAVPEDLMPH